MADAPKGDAFPGTAAAEAAVSTWAKHFDDLWALSARPGWRPAPVV